MRKRIVGRTVGTPMNPEKFVGGGGADLSDDLPSMNGEKSAGVSEEAARADHVHPSDTSRMPDISLMTGKITPADTDRIPIYDSADQTMKYALMSRIISIVKKAIDVVPKAYVADYARAVQTLDGEHYAVLPEGMTSDGVIALASDIAAALVGYATEEFVKGYAQEKGEYQPKGTYLIPADLNTHNTATDSHNDIRLLINEIISWIEAFADIDDESLNQMSEFTKYIKDNRSLIEQVTTSKVNVADIINNLTTNVANKPLSAAQGVVLKSLIDAITVPTKLSELSGDSTHRLVTDAEKAAWDSKSDFSGKYADLDGKPTIPTVPTKVSAFDNDAGYVTSDNTVTLTGVDENGTTHTWTLYGVKS